MRKDLLEDGLDLEKKSPSDTVRGDIKNANDEVVGIIEGSWLGYIDFTDTRTNKTERLWSIKDTIPNYPQPVSNPLPSDARFREDLIALEKGDLELAQQMKEKLEDKQRREKKLRKGMLSTASSSNLEQYDEDQNQ
jgi:hypothetical protein